MERKSFMFRKEWKDAVAVLQKKERLSVYEAIIEYALTGDAPELSQTASMAFGLIQPAIDRDLELYKETCRKRAEAGRMGGAPKGNRNAGKEEQAQQPKSVTTPVKVTSTKAVAVKPKEEVVPTGANAAFAEWLKKKCPYIYANIPMMKDEEFGKLKEQYGSKAISEVCLDLENRKDLRKRYSSLYRTLLNWLKNYVKSQNNGNNNNNPTTAEERAADAASSVARLLAEDDAG